MEKKTFNLTYSTEGEIISAQKLFLLKLGTVTYLIQMQKLPILMTEAFSKYTLCSQATKEAKSNETVCVYLSVILKNERIFKQNQFLNRVVFFSLQ